jgi:hypothetical protein
MLAIVNHNGLFKPEVAGIGEKTIGGFEMST